MPSGRLGGLARQEASPPSWIQILRTRNLNIPDLPYPQLSLKFNEAVKKTLASYNPLHWRIHLGNEGKGFLFITVPSFTLLISSITLLLNASLFFVLLMIANPLWILFSWQVVGRWLDE